MKREILIFSILFCLFIISLVNAETNPVSQCKSDSDCASTEFCEFDNCDYEAGEDSGYCTFRPDANQCEVVGPVCGCDGNTYQSNCHRQAAGVSMGYRKECIDQISFKDCDMQSDCYGGLECIEFFDLKGVVPPRIGTKCAEPDPCSYFDCSEYIENSVCEVKEVFPFSPKVVVCSGNCKTDSDCESNEFCDHFPPDSVAGTCTQIPTPCPSTSSPVCGSDGTTYQNDCLRKQNLVFRNYNGNCVSGISNVSCDVDDYEKDTCDFMCPNLTKCCFEFPGIGRRCASYENNYTCPENLELREAMTFPIQAICSGNCTTDDDCGSNDHTEFVCSFTLCNATTGICLEKKTCPDIYYPVCGCDGITYKNPCFLTNAGIARQSDGECGPQGVDITEITCDAQNPCPEALDMDCFSFPSLGLRCARRDPCSYYECPVGTECGLGMTYPAQVICSGTCEGEECETGVSYDIVTGKIEFIKNNKKQTEDITLRTAGSRGILETATISVKYSNELTIQESKLMMKTSAGEKQINILPGDVISMPETPDKESVKDMELKEEAGKPIYSLKEEESAKLLAIFPVTLETETKVSAESGELISVVKPWWSFLAW
ncbi:MAG: hypothetical protein GTN76_02975 [Candidatus Aenigmarchaeota archaeon]|nr:hypothetical protein [Candidatus Aenigmarchaeota archaeon]